MSSGKHPVSNVQWVPVEKVRPNNYNPNSVAPNELDLLYTSIKHDGYTQPIVTYYDKDNDEYVIVDGFHRYFVLTKKKDILDSTGGLAPVVVIDKSINDRMSSTVRHNRARGKHAVTGMTHIVFKMLSNGWTEEQVCKELGLEAEELVRLKHISGFSKLFADHEYNQAWEHRNQIKLRKQYESSNTDGDTED